MAPANLNIKFADELLLSSDPDQALISLRLIFDRDMINDPCKDFNGRKMIYARDPIDADRAFHHLTTKKDQYGPERFYDPKRARRLHWIKRFLEKGLSQNKYLVFSYDHPSEGIRTYIYHKILKHVVILEPNIVRNEYYLITSYLVERNRVEDIMILYEKKMDEIF